MAEKQMSDMTVIGRDTKIKGEMEFESGARILGQFEGRIRANGEVQIGDGAICNAAIEAARIIVDGSVSGDMLARERLTLSAGATVQGDITAGMLVVVEGATFVGHCRVGPEAANLTAQRPAAQAAPARGTASNGTGHAGNGRMVEAKQPVVAAEDFTPPWRQTQANGLAAAAARNGTDDEAAA